MEDLLQHRREKDRFFATSHHSPLAHDARHGFTGLPYFDPNPALDLRAPVHAPEDTEPFTIQTSTGAAQVWRRWGVVTFAVDGVTTTVTMLQRDGQDGFFVPFRDATSGTESYPAGRYIDLEPDAVDRTTWTVHLDFNYAYSPSCAYDDRFSCPLPPPENWLQVPIRAGEKVWKPT